MAKSVFEQIKKQNGERFAKAIRSYDNGIFDVPGIVDIVKYAGNDAERIMAYLESLKQISIEETGVYQDPLTLLDKAGYDAYYVANLEEQNRIARYFASAADLENWRINSPSAQGEALCTFRDPHRFENYYIINAVKKNVDQIRREDFKGKERREDEYGTSVISIQILKKGGFISIKNRYNHTVPNPDNTFNSNPDNIIRGLSSSLRHHFNTDFSAQKATLPDGYILAGGQIVRYNYEQENIYFGPNFYVKDGVIHRLKDHEIMINSYVFDMRTKTLSYPGAGSSGRKTEEDTEFKRVFLKEIEGHKVILKKDKDTQHLFIRKEGEKDPAKDIEILTLKDGAITALNLPTTTEIGDDFLQNNNARRLRSFSAPRLESMGIGCINATYTLTSITLPNLKRLGNGCFISLSNLKSLDLPALTKMGFKCFHYVPELRKVNLPALTSMDWGCFESTDNLESVYLPSLIQMGEDCLHGEDLRTVNLPALISMGPDCISGPRLESVILPKVSEMGDICLSYSESLETFYAPCLKKQPPHFAPFMPPLKRMIIWMKRKQLPKDLPVAEAGISAALRTVESEKSTDPKGISAQLTPSANGPQNQQQPKQRTSFFKRLRDWFLPQK